MKRTAMAKESPEYLAWKKEYDRLIQEYRTKGNSLNMAQQMAAMVLGYKKSK